MTERSVTMSKIFSMPYGAINQYDWYNPNETRTPEEWPYSFSTYWIIRPPENVHYITSYSDRMSEWDSEKYNEALKQSGWSAMQANPSLSSLEKMTRLYFGKDVKLLGFARSCNVSNGYPIGLFATT